MTYKQGEGLLELGHLLLGERVGLVGGRVSRASTGAAGHPKPRAFVIRSGEGGPYQLGRARARARKEAKQTMVEDGSKRVLEDEQWETPQYGKDTLVRN